MFDLVDASKWTPDDLDRLAQNRLSAVKIGKKRTKLDLPRHAKGDDFIRGPIPLDWVRAAVGYGGKAGAVTLALWWLAGMRGNPVLLTDQTLLDFGVTAETGRAVLAYLERAKLVQVTRRKGRSPEVTLLSV